MDNIRLEFDAKYYFDKAREHSERGEYVDAVDMLYNALYADPFTDPDKVDVYSEIAYNYSMLGLISSAIDIYYRIIAITPHTDIGYVGAIQCLLEEEEMPAAMGILKLGLEYGALDRDEDSDLICDIVDKGNELEDEYQAKKTVEKRLQFKLVGAPETKEEKMKRESDAKARADELLEEAEQLILKRKFRSAIKQAEQAREICPMHSATLGFLAQAYVNVGDENKCAEVINFLIEQLDKLDSLYYNDFAGLFDSLGYFEAAERATRLNYEESPYAEGAVTYAQTLYNAGEREKAKSIIVDLRRLYPENTILSYYGRLIFDGNVEHIPIDDDLPLDERIRRSERISALLREVKGNSDEAVKRIDEADDFVDDVMWALKTCETPEAIELGRLLCRDHSWQSYFFDAFVDRNLPQEARSAWIESYLNNIIVKRYSLKNTSIKRFVACAQGFLLSVDARLPEIKQNDKHEAAYNCGYAKMYALLDFLREEYNRCFVSVVAALNDMPKVDNRLCANEIAMLVTAYMLSAVDDDSWSVVELYFGDDFTRHRSKLKSAYAKLSPLLPSRKAGHSDRNNNKE